jgi:hypothetical protein
MRGRSGGPGAACPSTRLRRCVQDRERRPRQARPSLPRHQVERRAVRSGDALPRLTGRDPAPRLTRRHVVRVEPRLWRVRVKLNRPEGAEPNVVPIVSVTGAAGVSGGMRSRRRAGRRRPSSEDVFRSARPTAGAVRQGELAHSRTTDDAGRQAAAVTHPEPLRPRPAADFASRCLLRDVEVVAVSTTDDHALAAATGPARPVPPLWTDVAALASRRGIRAIPRVVAGPSATAMSTPAAGAPWRVPGRQSVAN